MNRRPPVWFAIGFAVAMLLLSEALKAVDAAGVEYVPVAFDLGGARYLRILANTFNGDLVLTIAAYNAGEGAVVRHRGIPPYAETQRYVRNVLRYYYAFRSAA